MEKSIVIQCVTPTENAVLDLVYSMASASDILVREAPRDAAALSSGGNIVRKIVARDDQCNIESEILKTLETQRADLLTRLMPVSQSLLDQLSSFGINRVVIGKKMDKSVSIPPDIILLDGALNDEIEVLNRPWLKRFKTGLPLITGLQLLGLDGVPVNRQQPICWGLEKFDLQSRFISSGCIVNPENLPDIQGLVDCDTQGRTELGIFGIPIKIVRVNDAHLVSNGRSLPGYLTGHKGCHVTWCLGHGTLESLYRIGMIDEVITHVVPAIKGRVINRGCSSMVSADSIGNFARVRSILRNPDTCDS